MIGVDTNILVRAILEDCPKEAVIAKNFLKLMTYKKKVFISSYAILEMVWFLKVKGLERKVIVECVLDLVDSEGVMVGQREVVISALEKYQKGKADFGDYLILAEGEKNDTPALVSFDKALCKENASCEHPSTYLVS